MFNLRQRVAMVALLILTPTFCHAEVVADWLAAGPKALANSPRGQVSRATLLANLAMFNALNTITPRSSSYGPAIDLMPDVSPDAAAATAAWVVLSIVPGADQASLAKALGARDSRTRTGNHSVAAVFWNSGDIVTRLGRAFAQFGGYGLSDW